MMRRTNIKKLSENCYFLHQRVNLFSASLSLMRLKKMKIMIRLVMQKKLMEKSMCMGLISLNLEIIN